MQPQKRSWLYGGLAHPPSVVLARRDPQRNKAAVRKRLPPGSTLLLAGDRYAWGLSPFLGQLCRDTNVRYVDDVDDDATIESWAKGRLSARVQAEQPHMVMVSLGPRGVVDDKLVTTIAVIAADARSKGATLVWLRPPDKGDASRPFRLLLDEKKIPSFHSEALALPRGLDGDPSARGYAGWAGALWRWIG